MTRAVLASITKIDEAFAHAHALEDSNINNEKIYFICYLSPS
jgi:hypothetical protein